MLLIREIVTPKKSSFTVKIPESMVGKTVEILAFEILDQKKTIDKEQRLTEIEALTNPSLVDLSTFIFSLDQANDYRD